VAPLRERNEDIPALVEHFLTQLASVHRRAKSSLSANALRLLMKYSFPGNVRQLRSVLERAMQNSTGPEIQEDDLPSFVREANGRPLMSLEDLEREYISEVLTAMEGRKSKAAEILGISRKTLLEKRKKYGLE
jgi:DNA-binding NtrC family response regulator